MALVTQNNSGAMFSSLLAPFTGVNNGSARLLKAISAGELATLREGDVVYVISFRNYWKWLPTSVLTSDDTTISAPTIVGAGAGRFERLTNNESPDWKLQTTWFIDSTAANQEGNGLTALTPLQSDIELVRRWGSDGAIQLSPQVTITYAQAPTTISNFDIRILDNASVTWIGTPTVNKTGIVLTAVAVQVRTAGAEVPWAITGPTLGAADVGKLAIITASGTPANIGAYARVLKDNGGGSVRISPFGTALTAFTQITPVVGDTISIVTPMQLKIGFLSLRNDTNLTVLSAPYRNTFVFDSITLDGINVNNTGIIRSENANIIYIRSIVQNTTITGNMSVLNLHRFLGGGAGPLAIRTVSAQFQKVGILNAIIGIFSGSQLVIQGTGDTYFQNSQCDVTVGGSVSSTGAAFFDKVAANTAITVGGFLRGGGFWQQTGAIPDWGTNNAGHGIVVVSASNYTYSTKPTVNGTLGVGREAQIGGTDKLYGAVPYIEGANNASLVLIA